MANPALNLLHPKTAQKRKKPRSKYVPQRRVYFVSLGLVSVFFILVIFFLSLGSVEYIRYHLSRRLDALVPQEAQFLVYIDFTKEVDSLSDFCDHLTQVRSAQAEYCEIQKIFDRFNLKQEDLSISKMKELVWTQFPLESSSETRSSQVLILNHRDVAQVSARLSRHSQKNALYKGTSIYKLSSVSHSGSVYYALVDQKFVFSRNKIAVQKIIDLPSQGKSLERSAHFRKLRRKINPAFPVFIYFSTPKENLPSLLSIASSEENILELEAYYWDEKQTLAKQDLSWFRFIPSDALASVKGSKEGLGILFEKKPLNSFGQAVLSLLDFGGLGQHFAHYGLDASLEEALYALIEDDFEVIITPSGGTGEAFTLIVPRSDQEAANFPKLIEAVKILAGQNNPQERKVTLPDGSEIIEYIRDPNVDFQEKDIEGIKVQLISFPTKTSTGYFLYGYLGNKLVISNSEAAFRKIVLAFRSSPDDQDRILGSQFLKGVEWFYFDLDQLSNLKEAESGSETKTSRDPLSGFKKIQGMSSRDKEGVWVKLWLGI